MIELRDGAVAMRQKHQEHLKDKTLVVLGPAYSSAPELPWEGDIGEMLLPSAGTVAMCKHRQHPSLRSFPKDHLVQSSHRA